MKGHLEFVSKRQEHKAVRKQEVNFLFNLIYKVVTLKFDIKIGLEKVVGIRVEL